MKQHHVLPPALATMAIAFCLAVTDTFGAAAVGSIGPDFNIRNHATLQPLQLYSYQGKIVLLDFWAYWCGPCGTAAQDMEPNIVQYYRNNGGNPNGVPVQVISISTDNSNATSVNNFIKSYGLELVGDDTAGAAYNAYGNGYIPYMVVLNGTTNSTNCKTWEVRYSTSGYDRTGIKAAIDAIQTPAPVCTVTNPASGTQTYPTNTVLKANLNTNGKIIKRLEFYNSTTLLATLTNTPYTWTWTNAPTGAKTITAKAWYGTSSSVTSPVLNFTVVPLPMKASFSRQSQNLLISWTGSPGTYQVQMATNLANPVWVDVGTTTTGMSASVGLSNKAALYRVKRL